MLDVERRVDVDAGVEELLDVLPALGVARPLGIGVGELVHQQDGRAARERRVEVELLERGAAVGDEPRREDLEPLEKGLRLRAPVGLDVADYHVDAVRLELARGLEHREGLADPGRGAEEELEAAPSLPRLLLLRPGEEGLGIGPLSGHGLPPFPWWAQCTESGSRPAQA